MMFSGTFRRGRTAFGPDLISRRILLLALCSAIGFPAPASIASEYYRWTDKEGGVHFSDSLGAVPPEYRGQIEQKSFDRNAPDEPDAGDTVPEPSPGESVAARRPGRYEVPYVSRDDAGALRIIIPVTFNQSVTAPMALDTGAPGVIISVSLAEKIGLFDEGAEQLVVMAGGIGGAVPAIRTIVDSIQVGDARARLVPTTVTPSVSGSFEGLVGLDFMSPYTVIIDTEGKKVVFEEKPEATDWPGGHDEAWWRDVFGEFSAYRSGWKHYVDETDRKIRDTPIAARTRIEQLEAIKTRAEAQLEEAQRLLNKLNRFASEYSVPVTWRGD